MGKMRMKVLEGMRFWRKKGSSNKEEISDAEKLKGRVSDTTARGVIGMMFLIFVFQAITFTIHKCSESGKKGLAESPDKTVNNTAALYGYELFSFDPNTISIDSLQMLGFSYKQALTIIHYREKGGRFRKKEDFSKMYTVSPEKYEELKPYISIGQTSQAVYTQSNQAKTVKAVPYPANAYSIRKTSEDHRNNSSLSTEKTQEAQTTRNRESSSNRENSSRQETSGNRESSSNRENSSRQETSGKQEAFRNRENSGKQETYRKSASREADSKIIRMYEKVYIDLNEADSAALLSVKGIGPYFCRTILAYRRALGSFASIDQLLEIKGMNQEKFNRIKDQVFVHPAGVKKFSIAEADKAFLHRHPYIGAYNARGIALFLQSHPKEKCTLKALYNNNILTAEDTLKLHPYIR